MSDLYVPGTEETDPKKVIMALQNVAGAATGVIDDVATNTTDIATNTAAIATNTAAIAANEAAIAATSASLSALTGSKITASLGADVALNNTGLYFDGPSVAQGATGTWFVSGTVTLVDTAGGANFNIKLWDGTTVIASTSVNANAAVLRTASLSGVIASPAANIKISVQDPSSTSGKIQFNASGNSKDSTITAHRIA